MNLPVLSRNLPQVICWTKNLLSLFFFFEVSIIYRDDRLSQFFLSLYTRKKIASCGDQKTVTSPVKFLRERKVTILPDATRRPLSICPASGMSIPVLWVRKCEFLKKTGSCVENNSYGSLSKPSKDTSR